MEILAQAFGRDWTPGEDEGPVTERATAASFYRRAFNHLVRGAGDVKLYGDWTGGSPFIRYGTRVGGAASIAELETVEGLLRAEHIHAISAKWPDGSGVTYRKPNFQWPIDPPAAPLIREADPELERLLAEEEAIQNEIVEHSFGVNGEHLTPPRREADSLGVIYRHSFNRAIADAGEAFLWFTAHQTPTHYLRGSGQSGIADPHRTIQQLLESRNIGAIKVVFSDGSGWLWRRRNFTRPLADFNKENESVTTHTTTVAERRNQFRQAVLDHQLAGYATKDEFLSRASDVIDTYSTLEELDAAIREITMQWPGGCDEAKQEFLDSLQLTGEVLTPSASYVILRFVGPGAEAKRTAIGEKVFELLTGITPSPYAAAPVSALADTGVTMVHWDYVHGDKNPDRMVGFDPPALRQT